MKYFLALLISFAGLNFSTHACENESHAAASTFGTSVGSGAGEIIEGVVTDVCQSKGCWMKVKTANEERFVRFKDYGFFVPKEIKGQKIKMRATSTQKDVSEKDRKHLLKDGGASNETIQAVKGGESRLEWLASGVEIQSSVK